MIDLTNKTALVCGASQGIGESTAIQMAKQSGRVILLARSEDKLQKIVQSLPNQSLNHRYIAVDLNDRESVQSKLQHILDEVGSIEILICNSGGPKAGALADATEEEFLAAFSNHVLGNALLLKMILPGMKEKQYGRVINILSTSVKAPIANLGVSNTIRAAVANWAKTLSMELASFGITVNNVLPGYTKTPRLEALMQAAATRQNTDIQTISEQWRNNVPAKRFAESAEVANAIVFLSSQAAAYINGINLPVDGGRTGSL